MDLGPPHKYVFLCVTFVVFIPPKIRIHVNITQATESCLELLAWEGTTCGPWPTSCVCLSVCHFCGIYTSKNKDPCKYYTGYRELPGAPCLGRDNLWTVALMRMSFCVSLLWYSYIQNKDPCKYYTGYRELPGAPWQSLGLGRVSISAKNSNSRVSLHCYSCQGSLSKQRSITGLS